MRQEAEIPSAISQKCVKGFPLLLITTNLSKSSILISRLIVISNSYILLTTINNIAISVPQIFGRKQKFSLDKIRRICNTIISLTRGGNGGLPNRRRMSIDEILEGVDRRTEEQISEGNAAERRWTEANEGGGTPAVTATVESTTAPIPDPMPLPEFNAFGERERSTFSDENGYIATDDARPTEWYYRPTYASRSSRTNRFGGATMVVDYNGNTIYELAPGYIRNLSNEQCLSTSAEVEAIRASNSRERRCQREPERERELETRRRQERERVGQEAAIRAQEQAAALDWSDGCRCQGCYARSQRNTRNRDSFDITMLRLSRGGEPEREAGFFVCAGCRRACNALTERFGRRVSNMQTVMNHHTVCNSCVTNPNAVFSCGMCSNVALIAERVQDTLTEQDWCGNCHSMYGTNEQGQRRCRHCGNRYDVSGVSFNRRGECQNCCRRNLIRPYDDNVRRHCVMIGEPKDGIFLGVELEVEATNIDRLEAAERLQNAIQGFGILKRDGSLSENGIEIVSTPISFDKYYSGMWDSFFADHTLEGLRSAKTETCGMHVHVSRTPLTKLQIGKIIAFVHNPANAAFIEAVAQRPSNYYGDFRRYKTETEIFRDVSDRNNRYTAVNLRNPHTVEFRIFKGTISKTTFFKNIEFCHALVKFCGGTSRSLGESANHLLFSAYVFQERKTYPHLWQFLVRRGFCPVFKNVTELSSFVNSVGKVARKQYLDERAKNRLANGLVSVRARDMNYYRGVQEGTMTGRITSRTRLSDARISDIYGVPRMYESTQVYDIVRDHERNEILNTLRSNQIEFDDVPTPENSPEYSEVWGNCDCSYCESATEQERRYEQERVQMLRERYRAFARMNNAGETQAEPEVVSLSDLLGETGIGDYTDAELEAASNWHN